MTNIERIQNMSDKTLAAFLGKIHFSCEYRCVAEELWRQNHPDDSCFCNCDNAILEWLHSEAEAME